MKRGGMNSPHIVYTQRPDVTPEAELSALAGIYRFILDSHTSKKAAPASRPDDAKKESKHVGAKPRIP